MNQSALASAKTADLADIYVQRLDLGTDPFAGEFSIDYFYGGAMRRQVLEQAVHLCRFSGHTAILTGSTGSGTSALLDELYAQVEPVMDCCDIDASALMSPDLILESLAYQFRLTLSNPISSDDFLQALRTREGGEGEAALLMVDQAHFLSLESLAMLYQLTEQGQGNIRLLLVGEYQVEQLAKLAGFQTEQIKILELVPLVAAEIEDYLLGLLQAAGYAGESPLSSDQLAILHEQSGGNIAEIRRLAPALLAADVGSGRSLPRIAIPTAHVAAIVILVAALSVSYFYQGAEESSEVVAASADTDKLLADTEGQVAAPAKIQRTSQSVEQAQLMERIALVEERQAQNRPVSAVAEEVAQSTKAAAKVVPQAVAVKVAEIKVAEVKVAEAKISEAKIPKPTVPKSTVLKTGVPEIERPEAKASEAVVKAVSKPALKPSPATRTVAPVAAKPKPAVEPSSAPIALAKATPPPAQPDNRTAGLPVREQRLMQLPNDAYMLQLLGSVEEQRARDFVKQYIGSLPVTYFETRLKGRPWYVALTGPYTDRALALAAIKTLPASLQKARPWARSVASVQKDILARK